MLIRKEFYKNSTGKNSHESFTKVISVFFSSFTSVIFISYCLKYFLFQRYILEYVLQNIPL